MQDYLRKGKKESLHHKEKKKERSNQQKNATGQGNRKKKIKLKKKKPRKIEHLFHTEGNKLRDPAPPQKRPNWSSQQVLEKQKPRLYEGRETKDREINQKWQRGKKSNEKKKKKGMQTTGSLKGDGGLGKGTNRKKSNHDTCTSKGTKE